MALNLSAISVCCGPWCTDDCISAMVSNFNVNTLHVVFNESQSSDDSAALRWRVQSTKFKSSLAGSDSSCNNAEPFRITRSSFICSSCEQYQNIVPPPITHQCLRSPLECCACCHCSSGSVAYSWLFNCCVNWSLCIRRDGIRGCWCVLWSISAW